MMMQTNDSLSFQTRKDPDALLRLLVIMAVISMAVILSLTSYGISRVYQHYIIESAEDDAVGIGQGLYEAEKDVLLSPGPDGNIRLAIDDAKVGALDARLRRLLQPFDIVKIKIYSPDCTVVYSTDRAIIGRNDSGNSRLKRALSGKNDSKLEKKEEVQDLADERKFDVDVVETYIPIFDLSRRVIGSFEVYVDVTKYRQEIENVVASSVSIMAIVLLLVYGLSFVVVRRGTNDLKATQLALAKLSIADSLTGIYNQRHILLRAKSEHAKLSRSGGNPALGIVMIDVDYFKSINDTFGHVTGDSVLQEIAARIVRSVRTYDEVGRYGGEEFIVLLPNSGLEQSASVAERIRAAIRETPIIVEGDSISVTASIGVACSFGEDGDYTAGLKRADAALYVAKRSGRDQISLA